MKNIIISLVLSASVVTTYFVYRHFYRSSDLDNKQIIKMLNSAYADEWFAYYQYWVGALLAQGPQKEKTVEELNEHAMEEFKHADMLAKRIIELGGKPVLEPKKWYAVTGCGYEAPRDPQTLVLLQQNIKGEACAIKVYKQMIKQIKKKDSITTKMLNEILRDEIKHKKDLEKILGTITKSQL